MLCMAKRVNIVCIVNKSKPVVDYRLRMNTMTSEHDNDRCPMTTNNYIVMITDKIANFVD